MTLAKTTTPVRRRVREGLSYSSGPMRERRQRVLAEVRNLLAEHGGVGFTMRELCERANVAPRTIYSTFGGKDGVIAHAIAGQIDSLKQGSGQAAERGDLESVLAEYDLLVASMLQVEAYARAIVTLYFSSAATPDILESISEIPAAKIKRWLGIAEERGQLLEKFDRDEFVSRFVDSEYACVRRWVMKEIPDDEIALYMKSNFILATLSISIGVERDRIVGLFNSLNDARRLRSRINPMATVR